MTRLKFIFLCLMLLAALSANVQGAHVYWQGYSTDFGDALNWLDPSIPLPSPPNPPQAHFPGPTDIAVVTTDFLGGPAIATMGPVDTAPPNAIGELWMAGAPGSVATLSQSEKVINVNNWVVIGQGYGGDPDAQPGGTATLDLSGTAVFNQVVGGSGDTHIAETSGDITTTGTLNLSGNAVYNNNHGRFSVGLGTGALGYVTIKDTATLNLANEWHQLGFVGGTAQITQDGGTVNHNITAVPDISDANGWSPNGHLIVGGWGGSATYDMNGGALNASSTVVLGDARLENPNAYGIFNLNGGTMTVPGIQAGFAWDSPAGVTIPGTFNFNGGQLIANASSPKYTQAYGTSSTLTLYVKAGGAKIDTNGNNITIGLPLLDGGGGGGLVKSGLGSLKLNGVNTYTGLTDVTAGTLGGSGTIAGVIHVQAGAGIAPGDPATLTVGDITFNDSSYLNIAFDGAAHDVLNSTGTLTLASDVTLNVSQINTPVPGDYDVLDWVTKSGDFATVNLPSITGWTYSYNSATGVVSIVPEPATIVLLLMGALMLYWRRKR